MLGDVMDDWQRTDYEALDSGWRVVAGHDVESPVLRAYLERPRGHDKTTGTATMLSWALLASPSPLKGIAAASDKDQAQLIRDAVNQLVSDNPWLGMFLKVHNYEVINVVTGSKLKILATDAAGNFGKNPDFIIVDELTHWLNEAQQKNWHALFSAAAKRPNCMLVVISNAGIGQGTGWQWELREKARTRENWYFSRIDGPKASWITKARLDEQRDLLPPAVYKRLWDNLWVAGTGDALTPEDIDAAMTLNHSQYYPGWSHIIGLDLAVKHDHAALVVLAAKPGSGRVKLAHVQSWKPPAKGKISLTAVREAVAAAFINFHATVGFYDPHQCELMAEELMVRGCRMEPMEFVGKNLTLMASHVLQSFSGRKIDLYADDDLRRDLLRLMIVEKPYGYKLESCHDEHGHADRAIAMAIALPAASQVSELNGKRFDDGLGNNMLDALGVR